MTRLLAWLLAFAAVDVLAQPAPRYSVAAAFDQERGELITFGGRSDDGTDSNETWRWNGAAWSRYEGAGPSARNGATMVWDGARRVLLLFGGMRGQQPAADTWTWDGVRWNQVASSGPPPRTLAGLAYDSRRQRIVLFGGWTGSAPRGDTWEWDGTAWIARSVSAPPVRSLHGLAYDEARGVTVLFAGNGGAGPTAVRNDTWLYDGTAWTEAGGTNPPKARDHVAMTYSPALQRVIAFGGYDGDQTNEMLEWDGTRWLPSPVTGVSPRLFPALTFDGGGRLLLFGGFAVAPFNELWAFECDAWRRIGP